MLIPQKPRERKPPQDLRVRSQRPSTRVQRAELERKRLEQDITNLILSINARVKENESLKNEALKKDSRKNCGELNESLKKEHSLFVQAKKDEEARC